MPRPARHVDAAKTASVAEPMNPDGILTKEKLAEHLKVSERAVYNLTRARTQRPIPFFYAGKQLRFYWPAVSAWLQNQPKREYKPRKRRYKKREEKKAA